MTLRPPAHCSSPEIAFAERCSEINIQRQNSGDSLPESNNPFLAMSSADLKDMEDEIDRSVRDVNKILGKAPNAQESTTVSQKYFRP